MNNPLLIKEFEPSLRAMLSAHPTLSHEISKFIKLLPVEVHNKIVKLCYTEEGKLLDFDQFEDVTLTKTGFRFKDEENTYDVTVEKCNNLPVVLSIFKESVKNSDIYATLELAVVDKEDLKELTEEPVALGSFTKPLDTPIKLFNDITYEYKLSKQNGRYVVSIEVEDEMEMENQYLLENLDKKYTVELENSFEEEQER